MLSWICWLSGAGSRPIWARGDLRSARAARGRRRQTSLSAASLRIEPQPHRVTPRVEDPRLPTPYALQLIVT
jgi:hypothetical protein